MQDYPSFLLIIPLLSLSEILTNFRHYSQRHLTKESGFDPHFSESDRRGLCSGYAKIIKYTYSLGILIDWKPCFNAGSIRLVVSQKDWNSITN